MKPVYINGENNELKYFIFGINFNSKDTSEEIYFTDIEFIKSLAFQNCSSIKNVFWDSKLKLIEKNAFRNCERLEVFYCGELCNNKLTGIVNLKVNETTKVVKVSDKEKNVKDEFIVQSLAFSDCENLHTIVFPDCSKLVIEKSAFENCLSLRTVITFANEISFTENPFEDCPKELTFVCRKSSKIERFARENGYRFVNA